jgi:hypothetical protein
MRLTDPEHGAVFYVVNNMRAIDRAEIYGLRFHQNPFILTGEVMAQAKFCWVAWHGEKPAAVIGATETHPGCWQVFCFGTDEFNRIALPLTRFVRRRMLPALFNDLGARRLEADSLCHHTEAHRWLESFGAKQESIKEAYSDAGDYFTFALCRDWRLW